MKEDLWFRVRFCACLILLVCAFAIRFSVRGPLAGVREKAQTVLSYGTDYKDAAETFARAFSGDKQALEAFGKKILFPGVYK
jgi:hypothetical protein